MTELLRADHIKATFDCGHPLLSHYLQKQAKQDMDRKLAVCFVMVNERNEVKGYYTLSIPPSYIALPVTLLGRLARDIQYKGEGLGELLLMDALRRSAEASAAIGSMAVVVDPIDDVARAFYSRYGFIDLPDSGKQFLSMKTIAGLF